MQGKKNPSKTPPSPEQLNDSSKHWLEKNWDKEWHTVKNAPIAFAIAVLTIVAILTTAIARYEDNYYAGIIAQKDAAIENLKLSVR